MTDIRQSIDFYTLGSKTLVDVLGLKAPPFTRTKAPFRQLEYIQEYVRELKCRTVVVEQHYIDRDHIEDHSAFYSRNFVPYENFCRRLHFFSLDRIALARKLKRLVQTGERDELAYRKACQAFSEKAYLGFAVIKPLPGCPVGRTILRCYPRKGAGHVREFPSIRQYQVHLLGVELTIKGLPFQQQDTGVSACATTAIWAALHYLRGIEDIAAVTPAQITTLASRYSLHTGRPMPSEGLSVDQMCQAIQAVGVSPSLYRAASFEIARGILYSATKSGMASILIMQREQHETKERHAVTVAGIKLSESFNPMPVEGVDEQASQLLGTYIHDDRWGPYVTTTFENSNGQGLLRIGRAERPEEQEEWFVTHILIPMHPKIRLSFIGLREAALEVVKMIQWYFIKRLNLPKPALTFDTAILRGYKYAEDLLFGEDGFAAEEIARFTRKVAMPRYVGVIRIQNPLVGKVEVLIDTTGTPRNLHCSSVVCRKPGARHAHSIRKFLAERFKAASS